MTKMIPKKEMDKKTDENENNKSKSDFKFKVPKEIPQNVMNKKINERIERLTSSYLAKILKEDSNKQKENIDLDI